MIARQLARTPAAPVHHLEQIGRGLVRLDFAATALAPIERMMRAARTLPAERAAERAAKRVTHRRSVAPGTSTTCNEETIEQ